MLNQGTRRRFVSGAVVLGATGVLAVSAAAATPYSVKLKVPKTVDIKTTLKIGARGASSARSSLTVFVSPHGCGGSATAEAKRTHAIANMNVLHDFSVTKSRRASAIATYHVCAYLTSAGHTRAHAAATYTVIYGGY